MSKVVFAIATGVAWGLNFPLWVCIPLSVLTFASIILNQEEAQ